MLIHMPVFVQWMAPFLMVENNFGVLVIMLGPFFSEHYKFMIKSTQAVGSISVHPSLTGSKTPTLRLRAK